ncbi:two-component system sensor histidine kinase DesK [Spinactinospora alkalitolerans]|uniref:Two-component system sensor histidine kinase DesK n=1 Tax=Spinactinospora alkalitolerans TaxID=687207 RepID=A0A852TQZ6_9ACTN|nr:sensor histidine kinase [Spinactinospora alkalitolerans]NYE45242.1 two-component system sensor histidine kinase DesK [Spinactinospora alkalitolerans]
MEEQEVRTVSAPARSARRLVRARWTVIGSFATAVALIPFFAGVSVLSQVEDPVRPLWLHLLGLALSFPLAWLCLRMLNVRLGRPPSHPDAGFWGSFALLLGFFVCLDIELFSLFTAALWWSVAALVAPRRRVAAVTVVLLALPWVRLAFYADPDPILMAFVWGAAVLWAPAMLLCNLAVLWLWEVANEANDARHAQARLAVTEERLRFARDMHDLIGHSLSGIAVKSELAARLAERDPARAAQEMAAVQQVARDALREVRSAVSGYRDVDLSDELASVRAVLTAAGVSCTVTGGDIDMPAELRTLTAWVVREGATNVLRHSVARRCDIMLRREEHAVVIEVHNDGARGGEGILRRGNGLTGLTERVTALGGAFSASATHGGGFLLRAVLPSPGPAPDRATGKEERRRDVTA